MAAMAAERGGGSTTENNNNNMNISSNNSGGGGGGGGNNGGRSLHNFSLPPCLSWGTQKLLRCSNSTSSLNDAVSQNVPPSSSAKRPRHSSPQYGGGGGGIDVVREKLMLDLRSEVDKMRAAFLAPPPPPPPRWNLRTRRAVCDDRSSPAAAVEKEEVTKTSAAAAVTVAEERGDGGGVSVAAAPRAKFSVALTRQEVEEDFVAMVGRRPPRKPKKRPRYIHKELETIFPGVWLSEVTADMYKVNETPEAPK